MEMTSLIGWGPQEAWNKERETASKELTNSACERVVTFHGQCRCILCSWVLYVTSGVFSLGMGRWPFVVWLQNVGCVVWKRGSAFWQTKGTLKHVDRYLFVMAAVLLKLVFNKLSLKGKYSNFSLCRLPILANDEREWTNYTSRFHVWYWNIFMIIFKSQFSFVWPYFYFV